MTSPSVFDAGPVGVVTGLGYLSRQKAMRAERRHPPLGTVISVNGIDVHYTRQGRGLAVIIVHGAGGNLRDFTFQLTEKMAKTNEVIAFDRPGHGYTGVVHTRGETPAEQADFLHAAATQIGIKQAIICGYSLGGAVAMAWALRYPKFVQSLILLSAVTHSWKGGIGPLYTMASNPMTSPFVIPPISAFTPQSLIKASLHSVFDPKSPPKGFLDYVGVGLSLRAISVRANARQVAVLKAGVAAMEPEYPRLTLPIENLHGDKDCMVYAEFHAEKLAATLPHVVYTVLPGIGHSPQHHAHAEILASLARLNALHG